MMFNYEYSAWAIFILTRSMTIATALCHEKHTSSVMVPKLVLLDRDGVVNEDVGAPGVLRVSQLELTPGAALAMGRLRRAGCKVALITNQSCVGKGLITKEDLAEKIHGRLQEMLLDQDQDAKFDHIFFCTSLSNSKDHRKKPNPGMIEEAMELFKVNTDQTSSDSGSSCFCDSVVFVGDTITDMEAASRAGVHTRILVQTGYGQGIMGGKQAPESNGEVEIVHDEESNIQIEALTENVDGSPKPSIFPMLYAKNLFSAVEWILNSAKTEKPRNEL